MAARLISLALLALTALGCDGGGSEPAAGSCRASVDELLANEECATTVDLFGPYQAAQCAATVLGLEQPPAEPMVSGEAYQVAYAAMCQERGGAFCDISDELGCDG